jgi:hypothetical protein
MVGAVMTPAELEDVRAIAVLSERMRQLADQVARLTMQVEALTMQTQRWKGAIWVIIGVGTAIGAVVDRLWNLLPRFP